VTEALENLLRDYIKLLMSQGWDERDVASLRVVKDAYAALAKARGET
jgi:hypothetical protein